MLLEPHVTVKGLSDQGHLLTLRGSWPGGLQLFDSWGHSDRDECVKDVDLCENGQCLKPFGVHCCKCKMGFSLTEDPVPVRVRPGAAGVGDRAGESTQAGQTGLGPPQM